MLVLVKTRRLSFLGYTDYKINTLGRLYSKRRGRWKQINGRTDSKGYIQVVLHNKHGPKTYFKHQLVLLAFIGPCPKGQVCRHFPDRNPLNCRLDNLQYGTRSENTEDSVIHGTRVDNTGSANGAAVLTEIDIPFIRARLKRKEKATKIAPIYGVRPGTIRDVGKRRSWEHVP